MSTDTRFLATILEFKFWSRPTSTLQLPRIHLTTSKVMVNVWRLRGNIIRTVFYRVAQKCKPLPNDQKIVLNRIKACQ